VSYALNCHSWLYRDTLSPSDKDTNPSLAISHLFSGRRRHSAINGLACLLRGARGSWGLSSSCPRTSSNDVEALLHRDQPATAVLLLRSCSAIAIYCPSSGSSRCVFPRQGRSVSFVTSDRCLCGSLDLRAEPLARGGSAVSTVPADRVTLGLSVGILLMVLETLRLVLCRLGAGSGVPLRGNSSSLMISLL
jgi:hypothetical protein